MHGAIFEHQQDSRTALSDRHLARYAGEAGADADVVLRDLESGAHVERVEADFSGGVRSGVNGRLCVIETDEPVSSGSDCVTYRVSLCVGTSPTRCATVDVLRN